MPSLDSLLSSLLDADPGDLGELRDIQERIEEKLALVDEVLEILEPAVLAGARLEQRDDGWEEVWVLRGEVLPVHPLNDELDEVATDIADARTEIRRTRARLKKFESLVSRVVTLAGRIANHTRRELDEQKAALDRADVVYRRHKRRYDEIDNS